MVPITIPHLCQWTNGKLIVDTWHSPISGVSTDTRTIAAGDLFVPIIGENFDGHNFVTEAIAKGASGVLIDEKQTLPQVQCAQYFLVTVKDTKRALGDLAKGYRAQFTLPLIAITGSNGKTTVKEMIAAILSKRFSVLKNEGNLNNEIGLPLTLFRLDKIHQVAVTEFGMSGLGEIRRLTQIAQPQIGVVTNVAEAHLQFFSSLDEIADAKAELIEELHDQDTAVLNVDDSRVAQFANKTQAKINIISFGIEHPADFQATSITINLEKLGIQFQLHTPKGQKEVFIPILGVHNVYNALAAAAAVWSLYPDVDLIVEGLTAFHLPKMRLELIRIGDITIINDAYNANPKSMEAALTVLSQIDLNGNSRTIAVLGTMRELGEIAEPAHREIGIMVASRGINYLVTVGALGHQIALGAKQAGMNKSQVHEFESNLETAQFLANLLHSGDIVLIKGSRKIQMEEIVAHLQSNLTHLCLN